MPAQAALAPRQAKLRRKGSEQELQAVLAATEAEAAAEPAAGARSAAAKLTAARESWRPSEPASSSGEEPGKDEPLRDGQLLTDLKVAAATAGDAEAGMKIEEAHLQHAANSAPGQASMHLSQLLPLQFAHLNFDISQRSRP